MINYIEDFDLLFGTRERKLVWINPDKPFVGVGDEVVSVSVLSGQGSQRLKIETAGPGRDIGTGC